jgi:hypothetical protein
MHDPPRFDALHRLTRDNLGRLNRGPFVKRWLRLVTPIRAAIAIAAVAAAALLVWRLRAPPPAAVLVHVACASDRDDAIRVLFVGNSHTFVNDLPAVLCAMGEAAQPPIALSVTEVVAGGYSLADHLADGAAAATIASSHPTWVVLQEQSLMPLQARDSFRAAVRSFDAMIRNAHARTALFALPPRHDVHQDAASLHAAYAEIGADVDARVVFVGDAWTELLAMHPDADLYQADGYHPRPAGTYLGACVFFAALTRRSPLGLPARVGRIHVDSNLAADSQRVAASFASP